MISATFVAWRMPRSIMISLDPPGMVYALTSLREESAESRAERRD